MAKKVGLPDFVKFKHDNHFVEELSLRSKTAIIRNIPVDKIIPNLMQPRKEFGKLEELAESIKEKGVLEPILVRPKNDQFELIAGERRLKASKLAGLKEIPCLEYDVPDNEALELSIIENIQRKDLNIFEYAYSLKTLGEIYGYTHQEIAKKIGKSRVTVTELLRITDLPTAITSRCIQMKINSKTFILELVKIDDVEHMKKELDNYSDMPFSREKLKAVRKNTEELKDNLGKKQREVGPIKFSFTSEDKTIKVRFNIATRDIGKEKVIEILENMISDLKNDKIEGVSF